MKNLPLILVACLTALVLFACGPKEKPFVAIQATLLSPDNNAVGEPLDAMLLWENPNPADGREYTYMLFMGKSPDALEVADSNVTTTWRPEILERLPYYRCQALEKETTYYWKVRLLTGKQAMDSETFAFTTTNELQAFSYHGDTITIYPGSYPIEKEEFKSQGQSYYSGAHSRTDGRENTVALAADYPTYPTAGLYIMARYCNELDAYGYDDWYLPAIEELDSALVVLGWYGDELNYRDAYWSSTEWEKHSEKAYAIDLVYSGSYYPFNKFLLFRGICVRRD